MSNKNKTNISEHISDEQLNNNEKQNKKILLAYRVFIAVGIIAIILLIIFKPCNCNCNCNNQFNSNDKTYFDTEIDSSVSEKEEETTNPIVDDLNKQVSDGMITMSMNTDPVFSDGKSKGNLIIENDKSNKHPQVIQIYVNDTNELVYTSSMIPIGKVIEEDTLDVNLKKGEYKCTAYFNAVDEKTGEKLGTGGADITLHILN